MFETSIELYPGETITITFENGTQLGPLPWTAVYNSMGPTGPLATGGEFYNVFVLGLYPVSLTQMLQTLAILQMQQQILQPHRKLPLPHPLLLHGQGRHIQLPLMFSSRIHIPMEEALQLDLSTAVFSILTFDMSDNDTQTFSDTVRKFLSESHAAEIKRFLIDVQQNSGGDSLLAVDTFKHVRSSF